MLPYRYPGGHYRGQQGVETEEGKTAQTALMAGNQNRHLVPESLVVSGKQSVKYHRNSSSMNRV